MRESFMNDARLPKMRICGPKAPETLLKNRRKAWLFSRSPDERDFLTSDMTTHAAWSERFSGTYIVKTYWGG